MVDMLAGSNLKRSLTEHLSELRSRLLKVIFAVLALFAGLSFFAQEAYHVLSKPLLQYLPENSSMIATEVASPFLSPFKLTFVLSIFLLMPYLLYQFWVFVAPGLYQRERRLALPLLLSSVLLFYGGIVFAYFIVFPLVFGFLTHMAPKGVLVMTDIRHYLDFVLKLFFAFGVAFEIPVITILLVLTGATTHQQLSAVRPYVIVSSFILGMLLTPPDIFSQILFAIPAWILFELGLFAALFYQRQQEQGQA